MIYQQKPAEFSSRFDVVGCFVEYDSKILLLHRQDHKPEGDTWGIPSGKVDPDEDIVVAMNRELAEETGLRVSPEMFVFVGKVYVKFPEYDFIYIMFRTQVSSPHITINPGEHKAFAWMTTEDALQEKLIGDLDACIAYYLKKTNQ